MRVTFHFEKSGVAERVFDPAPQGMDLLTEGQTIEIFFEKEGYSQDFTVNNKQIDLITGEIVYIMKFVRNSTHSKSINEIAAEQALAGMPKYDDYNFYNHKYYDPKYYQ